jgi:hypothetical protein
MTTRYPFSLHMNLGAQPVAVVRNPMVNRSQRIPCLRREDSALVMERACN